MAMRGRRRIGIVFVGVSGFWAYTFEAELLKWSLQNCTTIYESAVEDARKFARDADDMIQRWMLGIEARLQECMKKASDYARLAGTTQTGIWDDPLSALR